MRLSSYVWLHTPGFIHRDYRRGLLAIRHPTPHTSPECDPWENWHGRFSLAIGFEVLTTNNVQLLWRFLKESVSRVEVRRA